MRLLWSSRVTVTHSSVKLHSPDTFPMSSKNSGQKSPHTAQQSVMGSPFLVTAVAFPEPSNLA